MKAMKASEQQQELMLIYLLSCDIPCYCASNSHLHSCLNPIVLCL